MLLPNAAGHFGGKGGKRSRTGDPRVTGSKRFLAKCGPKRLVTDLFGSKHQSLGQGRLVGVGVLDQGVDPKVCSYQP